MTISFEKLEKYANFFNVEVLTREVTNANSLNGSAGFYLASDYTMKGMPNTYVWKQHYIQENDIFISLQRQINTLNKEMHTKVTRQPYATDT
jgi:hypothetical protein